MSKHNNSLSPSSAGRCRCGRYMTLGEEKMYGSMPNYECPACFHRRVDRKPLTSEEYYKSFGIGGSKDGESTNQKAASDLPTNPQNKL